MVANTPSWRPSAQSTAYVKFADEHYAKIFLDVGPSRADAFGLVTIRWAMNPKAASHILEPKPSEQRVSH